MNIEEYIDYEQVLQSVEELRDCADTMQAIFDEVTGNVKNMTEEETFSGVASTRLQEEFNKKKNEFDDYVLAVNNFANKFSGSTEKTAEAEKRMAEAADQINT